MSVRPEVSVVVASHDRPLRLRWLLNALEEQTLAPERWELIVVHDSRGPETDDLLLSHPLAHRGTLRHMRLEPGTGSPGRQRNAGWREARAPLIAFTDDDCRPHGEWLDLILAAGRARAGAVVQGRVEPDPFETELLRATHARTIEVPDPPGPFAQTCNILYPRDVLERVGGFVDKLSAGEDTDLCERARAAGSEVTGECRAIVYHAVESSTLLGALRRTWRWQDLAYVVKHHPQVRRRLETQLFWRRSHGLMALALAGLATRRPALAVPYARAQLRRRGTNPRARLRAGVELPGRITIDLAEMAVLALGSARHGTFFL